MEKLGSGVDTMGLVFFFLDEVDTVEALAARIIPGDAEDPGAREAGVVYYITQVVPYPDKQYPPEPKAGRPCESRGRDGRYHNPHLLLVRRVLEGYLPPRRSSDSLIHRRSHVHSFGGLDFLRWQHR